MRQHPFDPPVRQARREPSRGIDVESLARICHEANRAYCLAQGDRSQVPWDDAPEWQRRSAVQGVTSALQDPTLSPALLHELWRQAKLDEGWRWGQEKNAELKTHPNLQHWAALPEQQQRKDTLFLAIVRALTCDPWTQDFAA